MTNSRTTITLASGHGFQPGDRISMTVPDTRWWRRAIYRILRWGTPTRSVMREVANVRGSTLELRGR